LYPKSAGAAAWAKGLMNRIKYQMSILQAAHYLREFAVEATADAITQYTQVYASLEEYVKKVNII
jgi:hypothetical protein